MRNLSVARLSAGTQTINHLPSLLVSTPDTISEQQWKTNTGHCIQGCSRLRTIDETTMLLQTLVGTLRLLAKRWLNLTSELKVLDATL
ncbi:MAG: hypothetical protein ABIR84_05805 [Candidatus Nitrotoga sp.]